MHASGRFESITNVSIRPLCTDRNYAQVVERGLSFGKIGAAHVEAGRR